MIKIKDISKNIDNFESKIIATPKN